MQDHQLILTSDAMRPAPSPGRATLAALCILAVFGSSALAHWSVTNLHPPGGAGSAAHGVSGTQQVGTVMPDGGSWDPIWYASLWNGTGELWVSLHPENDAADTSEAYGVGGDQQVGTVFYGKTQRAALWSGTAESMVELGVGSALATSGTNQVGWVWAEPSGWSHASLWSGTPESWVDLHPSGATFSRAASIFGTRQVGQADFDGALHAGLWNGTAESWVDLHPASATSSGAVGTTSTQQVGNAAVGGEQHASLWSGTASSWVDLNPTGATESSASGVFGDWQVGHASFNDVSHASLWNGTAESWEDLSLALTGSWTDTFATGIWSDGALLSVAGYGFNLDTERTEALLWTRAVPEPSALALLVLGGLVTRRRRKTVAARRPRAS